MNEIPKELKKEKDGFYKAYKINESTGAVELVNLFEREKMEGKDLPDFNANYCEQLPEQGLISTTYSKSDKGSVLVKIKFK